MPSGPSTTRLPRLLPELVRRIASRLGARILIGLAFLAMAASASAQDEPWELRICAPPHALPFSTDDRGGFENEIASLLAEELGAELTYEWIPSTLQRSRSGLLRTGECDAIMGISEGHEGFLTSLSYYRSIYVFVYPTSGDLEVTSFDDDALRDATIALSRSGGVEPPTQALAARDIVENRVTYAVDGEADDRLGAPVRAVAEGEADLAIVWGPVGGWFASRSETELTVRHVSPQIDLPFTSMTTPISIGVRPHDTALRDLLDRAIVARWAEIQSVLDAYHVPRLPLPEPALGGTQ